MGEILTNLSLLVIRQNFIIQIDFFLFAKFSLTPICQNFALYVNQFVLAFQVVIAATQNITGI